MAAAETNQSLERGFLLLGVVASEPLRLSQIARRAGLAKSTTSRMLSSLIRLGAVRHEGDRFVIGPAIASLAAGAADHRDVLKGLAAPILRRLADEVGESAALAVTDGIETTYISQEDGPSLVTAGQWVGKRHQPHGTAFGIALMAGWGAETLERYLDGPLDLFTERTVVDPDQLEARCRAVADKSVVWTIEELAPDVAGCAAPVYNSSGVIVASIGCFAPTYRFPGQEDWLEIEARVKAAANDLSQVLAGGAT